MAKIISLSKEAYDQMTSLKHEGESFSHLVLRLAEKSKHRSLMNFFGKWPGSKEETENIKKTLQTERKKFKTRNFT